MEDSMERDMVKQKKEVQNGRYSPKIRNIIPQLIKK